MASQHSPRFLLRALWGWDLWLALVLGVLFGYVWLTLESLTASWTHVVPVVVASLGVAYISWRQRTSLRSRLDSDFGELLRISDPVEDSATLPYTVVIYVAFASAAWSTVTAIVIGGLDSRAWQAVLMAGTMFWFAWAFFGVIHLVHHSRAVDRSTARMASIREQLESDQRMMDDDGPGQRPRS